MKKKRIYLFLAPDVLTAGDNAPYWPLYLITAGIYGWVLLTLF